MYGLVAIVSGLQLSLDRGRRTHLDSPYCQLSSIPHQRETSGTPERHRKGIPDFDGGLLLCWTCCVVRRKLGLSGSQAARNRRTMLPESLKQRLREHLEHIRFQKIKGYYPAHALDQEAEM